MESILKILIVEDLQTDADLIKRAITKSEIKFTDVRVENKKDYELALKDFSPDIILSDYSLPQFNGMEALKIRQDVAPNVPFILVTGSLNELIAVDVMKAGADDYILKENLTRLSHAISAAIKKQETIKAQKDAEAKLRTLSRAVEQNPASIIITDIQGNIEYVNPKFTKISGYSFDEVAGNNPRVLKSGVTTKEDYKQLWETITAGNEWHGEFKNLKKNGEIYFESAVISPITDEHGIITHFVAIKEDITEHKQSEKLIKTLIKAIEQSSTAIAITNEKGKIEFVNAKFTAINQYKPEEVIGENPRIFNTGHTTEDEFNTMWQTLQAGNSWQAEFENRKKDGSLYWENVIITPLMFDNNSISNYVLIMEDITEKKLILNALIESKEKAEESDRLKTAFLHNISHEIRTPMNAIIGFAGFLNEPDLEPDNRRHYSNIVVNSSKQLLSIITDIIDIATIEAGQAKASKKETNVNLMLKLLFDQFSLKSNNMEIKFNLNTPLPDNESHIITDPTKLNEILSNLIGNAFKFTKNGFINVGYTTKNDYLEFYIEDSGIGIPTKYQNIIFDRFRQVESTMAREFGGSGLGLSISKAYVELLGGELWLESKPGKGSKFYFTIPFKREITDELPTKNPNLIFHELAVPKTILIAEDEDSNYMLLEIFLKDLKLTLVRARDGVEAVELCKLVPTIDLVLMDIKMPVMNGYEATKEIRKLFPDLPVIAQTAYSNDTDRNHALECGCIDYISKPIKQQTLLALISKHLDK